MSIGISSIGIAIPSLGLSLDELAILRKVDPDKYRKGLGCEEMSLCSLDEDISQLATKAAEHALKLYKKDRSNIGLIVVGSESSIDMSRPLSAWVANNLGIEGNIRSYEIKHACYGGTIGIKQAVEWKLANPDNKKDALVIAADIALYAQDDPGEPTQGAGAVAMIIGDDPIAYIHAQSYPYSKPVLDFYRPVGDEFPTVDGKFSLDCYINACKHCFIQFLEHNNLEFENILHDYNALCFHTPFPKMVKKAFIELANSYSTVSAEKEYNRLVEPYMEWNKKTGNIYTGSLWLSVANALSKLKPGDKQLAFSYGSGCGAELLELTMVRGVVDCYWAKDLDEQFNHRTLINEQDYAQLRNHVSH